MSISDFFKRSEPGRAALVVSMALSFSLNGPAACLAADPASSAQPAEAGTGHNPPWWKDGSAQPATAPGGAVDPSAAQSSPADPAASGAAAGNARTDGDGGGNTAAPTRANASAGSTPATAAPSASSLDGTAGTGTTGGSNSAARVAVPPAGVARPAQAAASQPKKPAMLFGRIEEISGSSGATLPLRIKMQALTPRMDPRVPLQASAKNTALQGVVASFPVEWQGTWSGQLKVHATQFDRLRWEFDPEEASREQKLVRPGVVGDASFNFSQDARGKILLQPTQVVFTTTMDQSQYSSMMKNMLGSQGQSSPFGGMLGGGGGSAALLASIPYQFAMHFGDITQGVGLTGNQLNSRLMRNDIRQLSPGVLEQVVVTYDNDRNPKSGKVRNSFSESVLRFTRLSSNQLYVQAASVNYRQDGKFENKYILYGTVNRGQAAPTYPTMPGMQGLPGGGAGLGGLEQLMRQLQGR